MLTIGQSIYNIIFIIGGVFSILAALMAYLITYNEYIHHYKNKEKPQKLAWEAAIVTLMFFLVMTLIISFVLVNYLP